MGGVASAICSPCGGSPQPQKAPAVLNAPGYEWSEPEKAKVSSPKLEPAAPPTPPVEPEPEEPKAPPKPAPTTPITIETLQGEWVNSMGAKIKVVDTLVSLNGMEMKVHPLTADEDGNVVSIGRIWQLNGWLEDEKIEWKECPSRDVMEFARSVVWTKATTERMVEWTAQMKGLGYTGSANDCATGNRGVEGCMPGTCDAKAKVAVEDGDRDRAELKVLNDLVHKYKCGIERIPPRHVIPDYSNRGHTGLSVEHVHYLATRFLEKGFVKRNGNEGHDVPVLVKESKSNDLGAKSISNWRAKIAEENGFPPKEHYERLFEQEDVYTSLGNGHFNQALNLFFTEGKSIYGDKKYVVGSDRDLREAVYQGVPAIILSSDIPLRDRETIAQLLNSKREFKWCIGENGEVDILGAAEDTTQCKQFEALSKVLDAVELNCLVRSELGVKESHRIGQ
mmetsp:Transcript_61320/g.179844  ORF Transcript_61320/g.179844 Transcript_61320/m.179844 type:complete len:450 (-) Transcript_61320:33-1382(-)